MGLLGRIVHRSGNDEVSTLVAEFHRRRRRGEQLSPAAFACQNPGNAAQLMNALGHLVEVPNIDDAAGDLHPTAFPSLRHYRVVRELGSGGCGVVYEVERNRDGKTFALKYLHNNSHPTNKQIERFEREAKVQQSLSHPNIVPVVDFSSDPAERYIVSELIVGSRTLQDLIKDHADGLPEGRVVEIATSLIEAIAYSHGRGILHRDVKPSNVMLNDNRPMLTDFGLAIVVDNDNTRLTQSNELLGTIPYMPPEMLAGARHASDTTDIYSIGVSIYEMLTASLPYEGDSSVALVKKIAEGSPLSPLEKRPQLDPRLDAIVMKCISPKPADRYASAEEMRTDLRQLVSGGKISAKVVGATRRRSLRFLRAKRHTIAMASLALAFTVSTVSLSRTLATRKHVEQLLETGGYPDLDDAPLPARFLQQAANHRDSQVRMAALTALRFSDDDRAIATIAAILRDDTDSAVKERALQMLTTTQPQFPQISPNIQLAACRSALSSAAANPTRYKFVSNIALPAIRRLNDDSSATLAQVKQMCRSDYQLVRTEAIYTVQWLLNGNTDRFFAEYLQDPATPVAGRNYLLDHMKSGRAKANVPLLIDFAGSTGDADLRRAAIDCLGAVTSQDFGDDGEAWQNWWRENADNWEFRLAALLTNHHANGNLSKLDVLWTVEGRPITFADLKKPLANEVRRWRAYSPSGEMEVDLAFGELPAVLLYEGTLSGKPASAGTFGRHIAGKRP